MNTINRYLTAAIVVQLICVLIFFISSNRSQHIEPSTFFDITLNDINIIEIRGDNKDITLIKKDNVWSAEQNQKLPAPTDKVTSLLHDLKNLRVQWPVATTQSAAERFDVSEHNANKTVVFKKGKEVLGTLYLGTSPGLRKVHARMAGDNNIYAVEFASYRLSTDNNEWFDKSLLKATGEIQSVKTPSFELTKADNWTVKPQANQETETETETYDSQAISRWVDKLKNIEVNKLIHPAEAEAIIIQDPILTINVTAKPNTIDYAFYKEEDEFYIKAFGDKPLFNILSYQAQPIVDATLDMFLKEDHEPTKETLLDNPIQGILDTKK